jgi:hypothetical protein
VTSRPEPEIGACVGVVAPGLQFSPGLTRPRKDRPLQSPRGADIPERCTRPQVASLPRVRQPPWPRTHVELQAAAAVDQPLLQGFRRDVSRQAEGMASRVEQHPPPIGSGLERLGPGPESVSFEHGPPVGR